MCFVDYVTNPIAVTLIGVASGCFGGYLSGVLLQRKKHRHDYISKQLDHLYGSTYALICNYEHNRNAAHQIKKNIWTKKDHDFSMDEELYDDYDVMVKSYAEGAFDNVKKIYDITVSNVSCAETSDIRSIEIFWKAYLDHISNYGSCESPPIFSNYFKSTKLPNDFLESMKKSYKKLYRKILKSR